MSWARLLERVFDNDTDMAELWWHLEDHRRYRDPSDCENYRPFGPIQRGSRRSPPNESIYSNGLRAETGRKCKPTMPLGLSLSDGPNANLLLYRPNG
jgi:hypothetical protein